MMAETPQDPAKTILQQGFFHEPDKSVGSRVDKILTKGYYFKNVEGLEFCRASVFEDKFLFDQSSLGLFKTYGPSKHHYCILNRTKAEAEVLIVLLWASGSKAVFFGGSHLYLLNAVGAPNGLLSIPPENLERPGITRREEDIPDGGYTILDGRTGFGVLGGRIVALAFVTPDELQHWAKMTLPKIPELVAKAQEIRSEAIKANFEFVEPRPYHAETNLQT
ncbi:hypothetical protein BN1723_016554 [Verticillium longisporum]|uniref:Uncharacterized protein n=1 Tax=Verticillium longisporum TaxID=100787 RepID=A0A0G4NGL5_VERLO|nr:hypothetical protein BN1708_010527 [Verticillium longisporum]CRK45495.1 hypothetical protein BN1723_016554 [Verticillium longisporum]